jgi:hypothetical protein
MALRATSARAARSDSGRSRQRRFVRACRQHAGSNVGRRCPRRRPRHLHCCTCPLVNGVSTRISPGGMTSRPPGSGNWSPDGPGLTLGGQFLTPLSSGSLDVDGPNDASVDGEIRTIRNHNPDSVAGVAIHPSCHLPSGRLLAVGTSDPHLPDERSEANSEGGAGSERADRDPEISAHRANRCEGRQVDT